MKKFIFELIHGIRNFSRNNKEKEIRKLRAIKSLGLLAYSKNITSSLRKNSYLFFYIQSSHFFSVIQIAEILC